MDPNIKKQFIAWCVGKKGLRPSTAHGYADQIKQLSKVYSDLSNITNQDIIQYLADLRIKYQKNENTRRLRKRGIELFYEFYSPIAGIQNPAIGLATIKAYKSFPKLIHPDEAERMCYYEYKKNTEHARRNSAILAFLMMTGLRVGEFEKVKLGDIERKSDHFTITVPSQKGTFARVVQFGKFIPGTLVDYFVRYYIWAINEKAQRKTGPLFWKIDFRKLHTEDMICPVKRGSIDYIIRRAAFNAGIDRRITVHQLRHFYATYSIVEGMNLFVLQQNMGHATIETTQRYVHIAGLITDDSLKHSPINKIKSSPDLAGFTELLKNIEKKTNKY